jgi:2,3-bisphosphoglycerate-independent phosphoglycerate mutase
MSSLVVLLDGAADEKIPELGDRTPLDALDKKFIDSVASQGSFGCTEGKGYTHLFMLQLMSGGPLDVPRGVIEAMGYGVQLKEGEIAYRLSPARLEDHHISWEYQLVCEDDAKLRLIAKRHLQDIKALDPTLTFYCQGKGILTVRSERIERLPAPPSPADLENMRFGELDPFIQGMMSENGPFVVMPWGGGRLDRGVERRPKPIAEGMVFFSKSPSVNGVAALYGLEYHEVSNYREGFRQALPRLKDGNVFLHVEETDDISHKRAPKKKVEMLADIDRMLSASASKLKGHTVSFIIDHGTSSLSGEHLAMRVPYAKAEIRSGMTSTRRFRETEEGFVPLNHLLEVLLG